jgi:xylulokinase
MLYIGIDLGTSSVKLILMSEKGEIVKSAVREYPLSFPHPGWSEQNPGDWKEAVLDGMRELTSGVDKAQIRGIGTGGQMHGLVVLDENDEVIRPAILWNDGRTEEEAEYLNSVIGKNRLSEYTGNIAFAGFTAPKLLWMRKHEKENFERIRKIMLPKDYINYILTGVHATDYSDASGMLLLDVKNRCWSREMTDICGIREEQLPKLCESFAPIGFIKEDIAKSVGLTNSVTVVAGAGDNAAAAVGTGTVGEGRCNISLGTSGTIFISSSSFHVDGANALHSFCHADGRWHLMACMLSAASCNKWFCEEILNSGDYAELQKNITDDSLGRNSVFFLPYLMGERSPLNDTSARSAFIGMSMDTTRSDMVQAVLEGVAFALRDSFETARSMGLDIKRSTVSGGGSKSRLWLRILASVLDVELDIPASVEGPGMGGAMLGMVGCGEYSSVDEASERIVGIRERILPERELVERYNDRYSSFSKLYPALKNIFPCLSVKGE